MDVQQFFMRYLLLPLIAVVSATILVVVNKKNKFINNKKLITAILVMGLVLAIPGLLGLLGLDYMPWGYILSMLYFIGTGCVP